MFSGWLPSSTLPRFPLEQEIPLTSAFLQDVADSFVLVRPKREFEVQLLYLGYPGRLSKLPNFP